MKMGIHRESGRSGSQLFWIPAFAGMTGFESQNEVRRAIPPTVAMYALVSPEAIYLPPGAVVRLPASWQDYQTLCEQRGDRPLPRIKYHDGEVFLMAPLPKHGREASLLADMIKVFLEHMGQEYDSFTPITMALPEVSGIEPDYCFYINNWQAISGKERIDWAIDPPPDLVLEIDVTSYSNVSDYLPYRVPEVWLFRQKRLQIYQLEATEYRLSDRSLYFPDIDVEGAIAHSLPIAYERNTSAAIRALKQWLGG